jgi:hypothetical protein
MSSPRVFEKSAEGLLVEIHPDKVNDATFGRRMSAVNLGIIYVLFTPEEDAAFTADENDRLLREAEQKRKDKEEADRIAALKAAENEQNKMLIDTIRSLQDRINKLEGK